MPPKQKSCPEPSGHRTAMGEYVPARGCRPLTSLGARSPGPADYQVPDMEVWKPRAPEFTCRIKPAHRLDRERRPGPAAYVAKPPACKKPLLPTLKPRIEPVDYRCSPGPVYRVTNGDVSTKPGRTTIKSRHAGEASTGHPSPLDPTSYTETPAPIYSPVTAHLPTAGRFVFTSQPPRRDETPGPGPGERNLRRPPSGARYTMRPRPRTPAPAMDNPPPDWYFVSESLPAVHAPKFGELLPPRRLSPVPAPNAYTMPRPARRAPEIPFRPFESPPAFQTPGPGAYSPDLSDKKRAPQYSIGLPVPATYPSRDRPSYNHGPATYNVRGEPRKRPAFRLTLRPKEKPNENPAPNAYSPREAPGTNHGFTLRIKPPDAKPMKAPGPNKYLPAKPLPQAPAYSLHDRPKDVRYKQKEGNPPPNAYYPPPGCDCGDYHANPPGASFKGRPSNYLFTGYDRARVPKSLPPAADRKRVPIV